MNIQKMPLNFIIKSRLSNTANDLYATHNTLIAQKSIENQHLDEKIYCLSK